jgi:hypothetical protein
MQRNDIPMVYDRAASQLPTLYVCPVENVLGLVPLLPCYLKGNLHNTHLRNGPVETMDTMNTKWTTMDYNILTWKWIYNEYTMNIPI